MKHPQLSGIATALAKQGRNGDNTLVHVSHKELAGLDALAKRHFGRELPRNPHTGLKEASLFQDWFGRDVGTALGIIAPIALGFIPGIGVPAAIAAGATMGAANQGLGKGGTTEGALLGGVMGGLGGYGGAGLAESLAAASTAAPGALATSGVEAGVSSTPSSLASAGAPVAEGSSQGVGTVVGDTFVQNAANTAQTPLQQFTQTGAQTLAGGSSPGVGSVVGNQFVPSANAVQNIATVDMLSGQTTLPSGNVIPSQPLAQAPITAGQKMLSGLENITQSPQAFGSFVSDNAKTIGMAGIGGLGAGSSMNPQEPAITTEPDTSNPYKGEMYMDPATGQWRSRAVRAAAEGGEMFSDYDAADAQKDGGYAPGGYLNLASGGEAGLASIGKGVPSVEDPYADYPNYWLEARRLGPTRRQDGLAAGGGIGDLGGYSDGGRLLRGPGDGVSDNIPATIENKRPARLADGEFVIPARAVSELGNGSTEAGSKQLYKMLDRIAAKRKSGKGLAYEANPKKLLPA